MFGVSVPSRGLVAISCLMEAFWWCEYASLYMGTGDEVDCETGPLDSSFR